LKGDYQMTTKREYLASKGITVGRRGRFSGAAKVALAEAEKQGIKFSAEKPASIGGAGQNPAPSDIIDGSKKGGQ
jgi:hypothetical protein